MTPPPARHLAWGLQISKKQLYILFQLLFFCSVILCISMRWRFSCQRASVTHWRDGKMMNWHYDSKTSKCPDLSFSGSSLLCLISFCLVFSLPCTQTCIHMHHLLFLFSVFDSHSCSCPQGSARSGWKLFRRPRAPPAAPRSVQTASPTSPPQTSEACWSSAATKAECWCP